MADFLNLKNPELVKKALIKMGDYPEGKAGNNGAFPDPGAGYSLEDAIEWFVNIAPDEFDNFVIYGNSGIRRYIVDTSGKVFYSVSHGRYWAEQAKNIGFDLI